MLKRAFEEQTDNSTNKRLKNDEREQIQLPNFELEFNMMESLSPIPIEIQSTITIGDHQPNEEHYGEHNINQIDAIQITSSSNFVTSNMNNDVVPTLSPMNTIIKTFIMTTINQLDQPIPSSASVNNIHNSNLNISNNNQHNSIIRSVLIEKDATSNNEPVSSSCNTTAQISDMDTEIQLNNNETNTLDSNSDPEQTASDSENINERDRTEIYAKLILSNSIVMSKSEICIKLKHVSKISTIRNKIISDLTNNKLLIEGNWFVMKKVNGGIGLMKGYLKAFPKTNAPAQSEFANLLSKYNIHLDDFEKSFKKKKTDKFPRILTDSDIKHNSYLYSSELADIIQNNDFLCERVVLDPSVVIQQSTISSIHAKRQRKPKQRYSPSDKS
ncbi:unnamed protein product [Rotaria magnacalcarata]|uniref:Uncharacterized protein n=1 Tax=Rotaria magnacalcarata TaxID=392030 RepID=A0A820G6K7_9BILA|nr:unnamed protein product [Rotaria magnacalcarata]